MKNAQVKVKVKMEKLKKTIAQQQKLEKSKQVNDPIVKTETTDLDLNALLTLIAIL